MEAYELLKGLERVKAPSDFEQKVRAQLSLRKRKHVRSRTLRFSLTGALAGGIAVLLVINFFILSGQGLSRFSGQERTLAPSALSGERFMAGSSIPIIETVDYASEIRTLTNEMPTVYILEQVSWTTDTKIKY
ncbi:MAG: hypothetical protein MUP98_07970 [Candidatus Aminicenantes bacterium]|nr:hypothetical protein [Candidatus Aminicenantes bacterium]